MIVIDSSALLAVLLREPDWQFFRNAIADSDRSVISAVNAHESATVLRLRHGARAVEQLWRVFVEGEIEVIAFDEAQVRAAAKAFDRYGKGIDPKTRLNLADCAYALSKTMNAPLLFKGDDFSETDVLRVA